MQFSVDTATNRLCAPAGSQYVMSYDAAGNLTTDTYTGAGTRGFDAEGRMTQAQWFDGQMRTAAYVYDATGNRVKRDDGLGAETWQVYGLNGELLAEYAAHAQPSSPQKEYGYRGGELLVTAEPSSAGSLTNVSDGKPATQSSTDWGGVASRAVDGNTSGAWADGSVSHTGYEAQPWWQVDLQGVQQIGRVDFWLMTECCSAHGDFDVKVSDDSVSWSSYYVAGPADSGSVTANRTGRYVRVQLRGTESLALAEVRVWAGSGGGSGGVKWLVSDHLGTPRMVVDQTGSLAGIRRHDYLPFGEEVPAGASGRTLGQGYGPHDGVRQKFTCYERDAGTNLDYAQARYYASTQGRFTSMDPLFIDAKRLPDPQQLNAYAYARNNPLKYTDPTGMEVLLEGTQQAHYIASLRKRDNAKFKVENVGGFVRIVDDKGKVLDKDALDALGKTLSGGEKELFTAISDDKTRAVIDTGDGQPNDMVDFGSNDNRSNGGPKGRNTLDMPEMKMLDGEKNNGGMTSGSAVAHETLEAYGSAKGMSWEDAHNYAGKAFGMFEPVSSSFTGLRVAGKYKEGSITLDAVKPDGTRVRTYTKREFPNGAIPGDTSPTPQRITSVEVLP